MNALIALLATVGLLLGAGAALGVLDRARFAFRWLLVAALLVALNDALLTRLFGSAPDLLPGLDRNWQGMALSLVLSLTAAIAPTFGWRHVGLTLRQEPGSLRAALPVVGSYCLFFLALALVFPNDAPSGEEVAFQLTMPGLAEEAFYRGVLLYALDRAFTGRLRFLGVDWGWGAVLSSALFGMAHAFGYADGAFSFDPLVMALTGLPALVGVWLRLRTGSLLLPIATHNFGNAISLLI